MKHTTKHGPRLPDAHVGGDAASLSSMHDDPLMAIKARKRKARARRRRLWVWAQTLGFALAALLLMGTMFSVHGEYRKWQARVARREGELAALKTQLSVGEKRLAALQSPQGRQQMLIENGYLRPGDRILEFPPDADEARQAALAPNDLTPHTEDWKQSPVSGGSIWRGAWNALTERWNAWRGTRLHIAKLKVQN